MKSPALPGQESCHNHCSRQASHPSCSASPLAAWCYALHRCAHWHHHCLRTPEFELDWFNLLVFMAFHLSLDEDYNSAELLYKVSLEVNSKHRFLELDMHCQLIGAILLRCVGLEASCCWWWFSPYDVITAPSHKITALTTYNSLPFPSSGQTMGWRH